MAFSNFLFEQSSRRQRQKALQQGLLDQVGHQLRFEDPVDDEAGDLASKRSGSSFRHQVRQRIARGLLVCSLFSL